MFLVGWHEPSPRWVSELSRGNFVFDSEGVLIRFMTKATAERGEGSDWESRLLAAEAWRRVGSDLFSFLGGGLAYVMNLFDT